MRFIETHLEGAFVVEPELISDERGAFTRTFCTEEFASLGITVTIEQINLSRNHQTGVFRGLHYQIDPHAESKFMRCIKGRTFNVIIDMRPDSATYRCWFGIELDPISHRALVVPEGFANGYQSLEDNTEVLYSTTSQFAPGAERGIRVDDPSIGIELPLPISSRSEKDAAWPLLEPR